MESEPITLNHAELFLFLVSTVRYALGRRSYVVGETSETVRRWAGHLAPGEVRLLIRDIRDQERFGYGMEMDRQDWLALLAWLEAHLQEREGAAP